MHLLDLDSKKNELICAAQTVHFLIVSYYELSHGGEQLQSFARGFLLLHGLCCVWVVWPSSAWRLCLSGIGSQSEALIQQGCQLLEGLHHLCRDGRVGILH